ncbi:MAG: cadherin domain-containing protein, partial [Pseudomonadota bacterium]|nr:cadherin domain-containing protein [Pseudomonadota bacterium]
RKYSEAGLFNTTPSGIKLNGDGVTENSSINIPVGTLSLTDDPNDTHVFALVDDAGGRFAIDSRTGAITVANGVLLDYEQATQHTVKVRATDSLGEQTESEIVIKVQNSLNERATGSALSDKIVGGAGRDIFNGAAGDDILIGGLNRDVLTGGQGRDIFVFDDKETGSSKTKADYITDYSGRRGDRLDLKLVDADVKKRGDQKFSFIGTKEFTKAGQVRYEKTKKETYVYLNTDSDKAAEAVIKLKGSLDLQKGWFVL